VTDPFRAYRELCRRVDQLGDGVVRRFPGEIACRRGCSTCCRHLSLFPVEALFLREALDALPASVREALRVEGPPGSSDRCPFLVDDLCLVYDSRPLICRTHGYPLLMRDGDRTYVDFCPLNFTGCDTLPGECVLDLDRLTTLLVAVNAEFVRNHPEPLPERVDMRDLLKDRSP